MLLAPSIAASPDQSEKIAFTSRGIDKANTSQPADCRRMTDRRRKDRRPCAGCALRMAIRC